MRRRSTAIAPGCGKASAVRVESAVRGARLSGRGPRCAVRGPRCVGRCARAVGTALTPRWDAVQYVLRNKIFDANVHVMAGDAGRGDNRKGIERELKRGSLELIVLHLLAPAERYGYEIRRPR